MEDYLIINLFFERKESAITETRYKYENYLFRISKNILQNNEDSEEVVNDTMMKAWSVIPPTKPTALKAFLLKIARNISINKLEAKNATKRGGGEANLILNELEECISSDVRRPEMEYEASLSN